MKPNTLFLLRFALLTYFAATLRVEAVMPPPDGGYANFTTAEGQNALQNLTSGAGNTALGAYSLFSTTTASFNTALGVGTLLSATADQNTAIGAGALLNNTIGVQNTASGAFALFNNTFGTSNAAHGGFALYGNTTGELNTADGDGALGNNTTGDGNTASGFSALSNNTTGSNNIALGAGAGSNLTTGDDNIDVAASGVAGEASTIRIGAQGTHTNTYVAGIFGTTSTGSPVGIDSSGHLGVLSTSSARFKERIEPMDKASEAILALKPVTFRYKHELDPKGVPQFGLVAEEVERVNPDLVARDNKGKPYSVRYEAVNAMLLNEFLKEHRKVEQMQKQIEALTTGLQKVRAQVEVSKAAPQTVLNNQ